MGIKPVPTSLFIAFLKSLGLVPTPAKGSHTKFNYPKDHPIGQLSRPVVVRLEEKEIPVNHISTNLHTLGKTKKDFEIWCKEYKS